MISRVRQADAAFFGNGFDFFAFGKRDAAGNAFFVADGGGLDGAGFCALRRDDAFVGLAGEVDQVVAGLRRRRAFCFAACQYGYVFQRVARTEEGQVGFSAAASAA